MPRGDRLSNDNAARLVDPVESGTSLHNVRELIVSCLDAAGVRNLLEIGAFAGHLTEDLLAWAAAPGARVATVDPAPPDRLLELLRAHPELQLHERTSHDVLAGLDSLPDAIVIDGDHNYYTLGGELRLIGERAGGERLPLILFHDVCWPHARRDTFYAPERVPPDRRPEIGTDVGLAPGNPGTDERGLPYPAAALLEGGEHNGTVTAIEDFCEAREGVRFAIVPAFFGFGVLWQLDAPWAEEIAAILDPFDRNPILERLESNRVEHLVAAHARAVIISELHDRAEAQEAILREMLNSRAVAMAERISRLYQRRRGAGPTFSRDDIVRALGGTPD